MKIGSTIKIINNQYNDYGNLFGKTGEIIAGGAKHNGIRRWLVKFDKVEFHVFEPDMQYEECEHNWVMDGHNAGDPICSICYKRE